MPTKPSRKSNFVSDNHALYCGQVLGLMMKAGLPFEPVVDDDGDLTNRVTVATSLPNLTITLLIPPPPDGWKMDFSTALDAES